MCLLDSQFHVLHLLFPHDAFCLKKKRKSLTMCPMKATKYFVTTISKRKSAFVLDDSLFPSLFFPAHAPTTPRPAEKAKEQKQATPKAALRYSQAAKSKHTAMANQESHYRYPRRLAKATTSRFLQLGVRWEVL